jgi:hypothetical protein
MERSAKSLKIYSKAFIGLYPTYSQNTQPGNKYYNINDPGSYTIHGIPLLIEIEHIHIICLFTAYLRALPHTEIIWRLAPQQRGVIPGMVFFEAAPEVRRGV